MTTETTTKPIADVSKVKVGDVFTRFSIGTVQSVEFNSITLKNTDGKVWDISKDIVEAEFLFADHVEETEELCRTEVINIMTSLPRTAMVVVFLKKPDAKTAAETLASGRGDLTTRQWNKKVKEAMEGSLRVMTGYHTNTFDEHGRLRFIEVTGKAGTGGCRLIDPRTIQKLVVTNKEYKVKK